MKKFFAAAIALSALLSAPAIAADLPVKVAPLFNWTGWYAGINGGYSWGRSRVTVGTTDVFSVKHDGGLASGEGGYCWQQIGAVTVTCLELRYDFPKERSRRNTLTTGGGDPITPTTEIDPFLFGPHFGYLTDQNRQLWYVAGGLAVGQVGGRIDQTGQASTADVGTEWKAGWFLGAGTERMIDQHWSWKLEYDYVRIGDGSGASGTFTAGGRIPAGTAATVGGHAYDNIITVGINYHFGTR